MNIKEFLEKYLGAIIGVIIGAVIVFFHVEWIIISIAVVIGCGWLGNYVQHNKDSVKYNLKSMIDKM